MFDIGFWELILVCIIALLVLGPERLPGAASAVGRWVGRARGLARQFRLEMEREARESGEIAADARRALDESGDDIGSEIEHTARAIKGKQSGDDGQD